MKDAKDPVNKLIFELSKLPGIGEKTAGRLAYFILKQDPQDSQALAESIQNAKAQTRLCEKCFTLTHRSPCSTCSDSSREAHLICVVEKPSDVTAIERAVGFRGTYHVLHGLLSPLEGIGPEDLKIKELLQRLETESSNDPSDENQTEVILALNPSVEGEATSVYLTKMLRSLSMSVSRLAHGIPVGGMLEYTDRETLAKALENRVRLEAGQ